MASQSTLYAYIIANSAYGGANKLASMKAFLVSTISYAGLGKLSAIDVAARAGLPVSGGGGGDGGGPE